MTVRLLQLLFSLHGRVTRMQYVVWGFVLMGLKYALDAGAVYLAEGRLLTLFQFMSPLISTRETLIQRSHEGVLAAMTAWALVFLWIGVSMSVRRAVDAGASPWIGLLFVLPFVNLLLIAALAISPSHPNQSWEVPPYEPSSVDRVKSALLGIAIGFGIAGGMTAISVLVLREYGAALFLATPFLMSAVAAYIYNARRPRTLSESIGVGTASVMISCAALLLFALEGFICISMALPIAVVPAIFGSILGRAIAIRRGEMAALVPVIFLLPLTTAMTAAIPEQLSEREVITTIEIDAPPEKVWPHVVGFNELPPPTELLMRLGIAHPLRAVIEGEGVGAVRRCEFSTGAFVEPITVWDPPRRLSFDVREQPPPMHEWSPYRHVHPPHLDGYLRTRRGEFRLIALPEGRTRLEGSTWYTLDLAPVAYWAIWSDALIHQIHRRVLRHIATNVSGS